MVTVTVGTPPAGLCVTAGWSGAGGEPAAVGWAAFAVAGAAGEGSCVLVSAGAGVAVGATPPLGSWPQTWLNVMSCGAGALFGPPLPHFQPCTSPSFAFRRLNANDEYTQFLPYCRVKNAQYVQSPPWHWQKHDANDPESAQPVAPSAQTASPLPPPYA